MTLYRKGIAKAISNSNKLEILNAVDIPLLHMFIKESTAGLCHPFSTLFNFVIDIAKVPQQWKLGEIVPVHKKECTLTKTNYRPLTI